MKKRKVEKEEEEVYIISDEDEKYQTPLKKKEKNKQLSKEKEKDVFTDQNFQFNFAPPSNQPKSKSQLKKEKLKFIRAADIEFKKMKNEKVKEIKEEEPKQNLTVKQKNQDTRYYETDLGTSPLFLVELKKSPKFCCKICAKVSHETSDCPGNLFCDICHQYGHIKIDCKNAKLPKCDWCQIKGHYEKDCLMKQFILEKDQIDENVRCFSCNEKGHVNCSYPRKQSKVYYCFLCGEKGHTGMSGKCKH